MNKVRNWVNKTSKEDILARYPGLVLSAGGNSFDGKAMGKVLTDVKVQLEQKLSGEETSTNEALSDLNNIWKRTEAADNSGYQAFRPVYEKWDKHKKDGSAIDFYINGRHVSTRDDYWFHDGRCSWSSGWNHILSGDPEYLVKEKAKTVDQLKKRASYLFDFETNSNSSLHEFFRQTNQTPDLELKFPTEEINRLVRQTNDFVRINLQH